MLEALVLLEEALDEGARPLPPRLLEFEVDHRDRRLHVVCPFEHEVDTPPSPSPRSSERAPRRRECRRCHTYAAEALPQGPRLGQDPRCAQVGGVHGLEKPLVERSFPAVVEEEPTEEENPADRGDVRRDWHG